ncbi:mechanosensitive ion channel [Balneolaceae bacterium YR4-1]|uniref:Mechanosensitive ion channel n=1 Tax=Halalkalibaculum roseum TaxID=2709311 RepID=A0A6M1SWY7_9BACT|nr:mechanosensitive ion channel domain-containing protein [Halalkalibaculum roseum]NGP77580.1 mechanosensitive ion channel [Halalkalibaculum roseum]
MEDFNNIQETIMPFIITYGLDLVGAIIILFVGWIVANWIQKRIKKAGRKSEKLDETLTTIFAKTAKVVVMVVVIIAVLQQFGVQTASMLAVVGAAGLAIGLAWQGTLSDIAAGIMLLIMRPFKIGDAVEVAGTSGVIDEIGLVLTKMHTFDNIAMYIPNSDIWGTKIMNYAKNDTRRVDMVFGFGYDDDMDKAMQIAREVLEADERVLKDPEPQIAVSELADSSVNIIVRPWTAKENYWGLKFDVTKRIKERYDEEGLNIPYPQRDVHVFQQNGS